MKEKLFACLIAVICAFTIVNVSAATSRLRCTLSGGMSKASTGETSNPYKTGRFEVTTTGTNCGSYGRCIVSGYVQKTMSVGIGDTETYHSYNASNLRRYELQVTGVIDKKTNATGELYAYD